MELNDVTVIDGGFSTALSKNVSASEKIDGNPLWTAKYNSINPNAVIKTHLDFLHAGAQLICTNTYQATIDGYQQHLNLTEKDSSELIKDTVRLAHMARNRYLKEQQLKSKTNNLNNVPWVVGSIGPYGAYLHDGSEYTGDYASTVSKETLKYWHKRQIKAIVEAGVNALAIETIPCLIEAEAIAELLCNEFQTMKFWISFQCKDNSSLASGENFATSTLKLWNYLQENAQPNLLAIGINCTNPMFITPLFKLINGNRAKHQQIPLISYPNSGEIYDSETGWSGKKDFIPIEQFVPEWIALGAKFIGGCCQTLPADIQNIRNAVDQIYITKNNKTSPT